MRKPRVMLDSGAYTAHKKGIKIDIDKYAEYVDKNGHKYDACFNLDSIGNAKVSYENWRYLFDSGVKTIPVYHIGTDEKYLKKYLNQTDYIGLGAIANLDTTQRLLGLSRIWKEYLTDDEGMPTVKVHGLGLTAVPIMIRYPWYSVDSFTPVISAVWGSILLPQLNGEGEEKYFGLSICKISDQGRHTVGTANSFLTLPKRSKEIYTELIKEHGFELGEIAYQELRPRRGKKNEISRKPKPFFDLTRPADDSIKTLANSWEVRMRWNLTMWTKLRRRLPIYPRRFDDKQDSYIEEANTHEKTLMYMGVSTTTHLEIFNTVHPKLDILISYAYLNAQIESAIKNYVG